MRKANLTDDAQQLCMTCSGVLVGCIVKLNVSYCVTADLRTLSLRPRIHCQKLWILMGLITLANRWWWMRPVNLGVVVVAVGAGVVLVVVVDVVVVVGMTVVGHLN
jgi:hypothetical protein